MHLPTDAHARLADREHPRVEVDSSPASSRAACRSRKHAPLGIDDIYEVWESDPLFYPAIPPAHWLMVPSSPDACSSFPLRRGQRRPDAVPTERLLRGSPASRFNRANEIGAS